MRVIHISDTHMKYPQVPDGDLIIHSGDFSFRASVQDTIQFNDWLGTLPHTNIILVPGNHDALLEKDTALAREILTNAIVLIDQEVVIDGVKFYGSPWSLNYGVWHFMGNEKELERKFAGIPDDTDVLITHSPPYGILDEVPYYVPQTGEMGVRHCGSHALLRRVLEVKPRAHCFGHIHPSYSQIEQHGIKFINAALMNDNYVMVNEPIVFEI